MTANMEGDGIGGAINMVMKDAPATTHITANLATGYNSLFFIDDYLHFNTGKISKRSPNEKYGLGYPVQIRDFSRGNMHLKSGVAFPALNGGFSFGSRFFKSKLGFLAALSYQRGAKGNSSDLYSTSTDSDGKQSVTSRFYANQQTRSGIHTKLDMKLSENHKLMWYNAYMDLTNGQVRQSESYSSQVTRLRWNHQSVLNSTLRGEHSFRDATLNFDWSASFGKAFNETPDNIQVNELIINGITSVDQNDGASRRWEHNSDDDLSGFTNLSYRIKRSDGILIDLSAGGMYRTRERKSYFNEYHFKPWDELKSNPRELVRGIDYSNFDEISFSVNSYGNLSDPLNYNASEKIGAVYGMGKVSIRKIQITAGLRSEYTDQGYFLRFPTDGARNEGNQTYTDLLPSIGIKDHLSANANLRLTYYRAINRPSFFEIVPYSIIYEDYKERGNPDLKHTTADNMDFRFEYYPGHTEQFMAGLFYKKIRNPIEFGMMNGFGQDIFYMPMNFGDAVNWGSELDIMKYFNRFGIKANYTFTDSRITTTKIKIINNPDQGGETNIITEYVDQTRPLYGQAAHVANFSMLFKDNRNIWDAQVSFIYTGDRLVYVSRYVNEDIWQAGFTSFDASGEKKFKSGLALFLKLSNILNTPMIQFIRKNDTNAGFVGFKRYRDGILERKEYYGVNFLIGIKFNFSNF